MSDLRSIATTIQLSMAIRLGDPKAIAAEVIRETATRLLASGRYDMGDSFVLQRLAEKCDNVITEQMFVSFLRELNRQKTNWVMTGEL